MTEPKQGAPSEVEDRLRRAFTSDPETSLRGAVVRALTDPAIAPDLKRRYRPHPLFVSLGAILLLTLGAFIYFSFSRH